MVEAIPTAGIVNQMFARFLSGLGKTLLSLGLLTFLFVAFQLWGTGVEESKHQKDLVDELSTEIRIATDTKGGGTSSTKSADGKTLDSVIGELAKGDPKTKIDAPAEGTPAGMIEIPSINVKKVFVEGTNTIDLKKGPGHYLDTPYPGTVGNSSIAGHRTTYGSPFNRINELNPGDAINIYTKQGKFTYKVIERPPDAPGEAGDAWWVVSPSDVHVLANEDPSWYKPTGDEYLAPAPAVDPAAAPAADPAAADPAAAQTLAAQTPAAPRFGRLTLTACHPEFSDRQRIIVTAILVNSTPAAVAPGKVKTTTTENEPNQSTVSDENLADAFGEDQGWILDEIPGILSWAGAALGVWFVAFLIGFKLKGKRWISYLLISPAFFFCIWYLFTHLNRALPPL